MSPPQPRLPIQPLIDAALSGWTGTTTNSGTFDRDTGTHAEAARRLGVPYRSLLRWITEGGITLHSADKLCVTIGLHPVEVYGFNAWNEAWALWDVKLAVSAAAAKQHDREHRRQRKARLRTGVSIPTNRLVDDEVA